MGKTDTAPKKRFPDELSREELAKLGRLVEGMGVTFLPLSAEPDGGAIVLRCCFKNGAIAMVTAAKVWNEDWTDHDETFRVPADEVAEYLVVAANELPTLLRQVAVLGEALEKAEARIEALGGAPGADGAAPPAMGGETPRWMKRRNVLTAARSLLEVAPLTTTDPRYRGRRAELAAAVAREDTSVKGAPTP